MRRKRGRGEDSGDTSRHISRRSLLGLGLAAAWVGLPRTPAMAEGMAGPSGTRQFSALLVKPSQPSTVPLKVAGTSAHASSLQEWTDSGLAPLASVDPRGGFHVPDVVTRGPKPWVDVRAFGAVGDGIADDAPAIQAALDSLPAAPAGGGVVFLPAGTYRLGTGLVSAVPNVELVGVGGVGQSTKLGGNPGPGRTTILVPPGAVGFTWGNGVNNLFQGPVIRSLHFKASDPSAKGGVHLMGASNFLLDHVACSGFSGSDGYGFWIDGLSGGNLTSYGSLIECKGNDCTVGLDVSSSNGVRLFGGLFDGADNDCRVVLPASTGIRVRSGGSFGLFGTRVQSYAVGIDLQGGEAHQLFGPRLESFGTGLRIASIFSAMFGGTFTNYAIGSTGTAIELAPGAGQSTLMPTQITSVQTRVLDNGENTMLIDRGTISSGFTNGMAQLVLGKDAALYRPNGVQNVLATEDQLRAADGVATKTKAGPLVDADFTAAPRDGTIAVDTANNRLAVRVGGAWRYAALA